MVEGFAKEVFLIFIWINSLVNFLGTVKKRKGLWKKKKNGKIIKTIC